MAETFQVIRARQRALTALLPHPGNQKVFNPSRPNLTLAPAFAQTHAMSAGRTTPTVGYDTVTGPIGTLAPLTFRGVSVVRISMDEVTDVFRITLAGLGHGVNFWTRIRFESSDNFWDDTELLSADATFTTATNSVWTYNSFTRVFINGIQYRMDWEF